MPNPVRNDPIESRAPAGSVVPRLIPALVLIAILAVILGVTYLAGAGRRDVAPAPAAAATSTGGASDVGAGQPLEGPVVQAPPELNDANLTSRMQAMERESEKVRARHQEYARRYSGERVDASWAGPHESRMLAASRSDQIAQLHAEPHALDIDCKATMCRVVADFATRSVAEDWFTLFSIGGSDMPNASYEHSFNPDGTARVTIYGLMRE